MPASKDPLNEGNAARPPLSERAAGIVKGIAADTTPLRKSRDYRLLFFGGFATFSGHQITVVAVFYQVYALTKSPAAVGLVGLAQVVPLAIAAIGGGAIVDSVDRRKTLLIAQVGVGLGSGVLMVASLLGKPPVVLIYAAVGLSAGMSGLVSPTRAAMVPNLVGKDLLAQAITLNQVSITTAMIAGPALAGVIIGASGVAAAYAIDLFLTWLVGIPTTLGLKPMKPQRDSDAPTAGLRAIKEGFVFLRGRRVLQMTFLIDLVAMIFGMPRALFPILVVTQFNGGPRTLGLLFSAIAVGALGGALTGGWVGRIKHQGKAILVAVAVWGLGITLFGLSGDLLVLGVACLAVAGAADVISAVFRSTVLQTSVPDSLRGRMSGFFILVVAGGPRLGDLEAGLVAQAFGPTVSVVSGGLACLLGVGLVWMLAPEFVRYRASREIG